MGAAESVEAGNGDKNEATGSKDQVVFPSALVIVGPSGVGKGTLIGRLLEGDPRYGFSVSHTTRPPRTSEQDGQLYYFVSKEEFERDVAEGHFLEYALVHEHMYGTSMRAVADVAEKGKCCVLDIDVQGARQVRAKGLRAIFVFVAPPSPEELERRLRGRSTESEEQVVRRLNAARAELASINEPGLFDYVIVNDDVEHAVNELKSIGARALAGESGPAPELQDDSDDIPTHYSSEGEKLPGDESFLSNDGEAQQRSALSAEVGADFVPEEPSKPGYFRSYEQHAGKVVIVTGASTPIGSALCKALASAGLRVVALARMREGLQKLQKELVIDAGIAAANFLPIVCDTTKEAEVSAVPRIVFKRWPESGVDILIHCEDVEFATTSLLDGNADLWRDSILSSMLSVCLCAREVVKDMSSRQQFGYIIVIVEDTKSMTTFHETVVAAATQAIKVLMDGLFKEVNTLQFPIPVCSIEFGDAGVSTTARVGDRTVQFSKNSSVLTHDILEAVAWCLIN